jgi:hypothetical protein
MEEEAVERYKEGNKKALVIAVSQYNSSSLKPIKFCENDGQEMYKVLKKVGYEIPDNCILIGNVESQRLKKAIYNFFTNQDNKPDDTLVFYYSGHGVPDKWGAIFLAPSDIDSDNPFMTGFSFVDLTNSMLACNSLRVVTILDSCYSGSLELSKGLDSKSGEEAATRIANKIVEEKADKLKQGVGRCLLASSQGYEEAFDRMEKDHSIFTYYLIEALKGHKNAVDEEGNVTYDSVGKFISREIGNLPPERRPNQTPIRKGEVAGGDIVLATYPDLKPARIEVILASLLKLLDDGHIEEFNKKRDPLPTNLLNFSHANLHARNLSKANLSNVNMSRADLSSADLEGVDLSNANLFKAEIEGAYLHEANLSNADLSKANLSNADLSKANLSNADLSNADLSNANLFGAYLKQAKVIGTKFFGSTLSRANLENNPLLGAIFDPKEPTTEPIKKPEPSPTEARKGSIYPDVVSLKEPTTEPIKKPTDGKKFPLNKWIILPIILVAGIGIVVALSNQHTPTTQHLTTATPTTQHLTTATPTTPHYLFINNTAANPLAVMGNGTFINNTAANPLAVMGNGTFITK